MNPRSSFVTIALLLLLLSACSDPETTPAGGDDVGTDRDVAQNSDSNDAEGEDAPEDVRDAEDTAEDVPPDLPFPDASAFDYGNPGPYPVGRRAVVLDDSARQRQLRVLIYYPAAEAAREASDTGEAIEAIFDDADHRQTYADLLADAPNDCPTRTTHSVADAGLADTGGLLPVIAYSHCFQCLAISGNSLAEHLASRGFVVAAPDHAGDTLFDKLDGAEGMLSDSFLQVRAGDIMAVLDLLLSEDAPELLRGQLDPTRVALAGHSFGSVTTGRVLQLDPRPVAGFAIAAPVENPLFPSVKVADINTPLMFVVAGEDNSISEIGNTILRTNYQLASPPTWKVEVADAGHWSFSDLVGLVEAFDPGCGEDLRQTNGQPFTYVAPEVGREIIERYAAAFFAAHLLGDEDAFGALVAAFPRGVSADARRE